MHTFKGKIIFIVLFVLFLFFLGCQTTHKNTVALIWKKDLVKGINNVSTFVNGYKIKNDFYPVAKLPSSFFYFDKNGKTLFSYKTESNNNRYTVSNNYYVTYTAKHIRKTRFTGRLIRLYKKTGEPIIIRQKTIHRIKKTYPRNSILTRSYPRLSPAGKLIVLFESGGMSFKMHNKEGEEILPFTTYGPLITCYNFSANTDNFVVGYINGALAYYNAKGREIWSKKITAGKYRVIKSVFVSDDGEYVGAIAGLYSEELLIFNKKGKVIWHRPTGFNQRQKVTGSFSSVNAKRVIIGLPSGAAVLSNPSGNLVKSFNFSIDKAKHFFLFHAHGNARGYTALSFTTHKKTHIFVLSPKGVLTRRIDLPDKFAYVKFSSKGNALIIQGDKNILCYDLRLEE